MDIIKGVDLSILITIVIAFCGFIGWVIVQMQKAPKVVMRFNGGLLQSSPRHIVEAVPVEGEPHVFDARLSVREFECLWRGELTLTNLGGLTASGIEIFFHDESPVIKIKSLINKYDVLKENDSVKFETYYRLRFHATPNQRQSLERNLSVGEIFKDFKVAIRYKFFLGFYRYTIYSFPDKNDYVLFRPHRFTSAKNHRPPKGFIKVD